MNGKQNIDLFIDNINPKLFDLEDEVLLYLSDKEFRFIQSEVLNGYYRKLKVKIKKYLPEGYIWVTPEK